MFIESMSLISSSNFLHLGSISYFHNFHLRDLNVQLSNSELEAEWTGLYRRTQMRDRSSQQQCFGIGE